jgi:transcriptional activator for dhaKLM operon
MLQDQNSRNAELDAILAAISEGILVWDAEGILVHANTVATEILNCPATSLVGRPISERLTLPAFIQEAYHERQPLSNAEASLTVGSQPVKCVVNLHFVDNDMGIQWVILTLRESADVRKLIQYQVGAQVSVSLDDFVGESPQIRRLRRLARTAAPARACTLIRGEVGTGKDYLGRALHNASPRRVQPFIIFGCSSVPNELVIGELLGYEEHLSPQRTGGRPSKFELADGGTLFFQDIEALPLEAQAILVNVLELGIVQRLGSTYPIEVDVRVIAASASNLEDQVGQGNFRADLFYRLSPFEIVIPPLREREGDLPIFIERILGRLSRQHHRPLELAAGVLDLLMAYPWPGNTRELEAVLERATVQAGASPVIGPMHLPDFIRLPQRASPIARANQPLPTLDAMEREAIIQAARLCDGNVSQMARMLGIGRTTVWRKLKDLDISPEHFRNRAA